MSSVNEKLLVDEWLHTYLGGDATISAAVSGVYSEVIPANKALPAIRFHAQAQTDVNGSAGGRILVDFLYLVVVTVQGPSVAPAVPIAAQIDVLLHKDANKNGRLTSGQSTLVAGINVQSSLREGTWDQLERLSEGQFRSVGGFYRLIVQPT
jgi:hypothetical protein